MKVGFPARRPTVPDWALNSVALQEPDVVADAVDAAEHLRSVQAAALGDPSAAPDLRDAMGREGRRRLADQFRHETMTSQLRSLYERLLADRGAGR